MAAVIDTPDLIDSDDQAAFNLAVWEKVLSEPLLAELPHRIETDRFGQIVMSPPPTPEHGQQQFGIGKHLDQLLQGGFVITECPVSTRDGVRLADVAWISEERRRTQAGNACFTQAPEICVEVISPRNSRRELKEKKALFFQAGAEEVWFCHLDGRMEFFRKSDSDTPGKSALCSKFPDQLQG